MATKKKAAASKKTATKKTATVKTATKKTAAKKTAAKKTAAKKTAAKKKTMTTKKPVRLLSGGNPQIDKGYGDAPVKAYLDALPGWKSEVGHHVDRLIEKVVPGVKKAVKWNTPFYGVEEGVWFMAMHALKGSLQLTFFRGTSLDPVPQGPSKVKDTRYHHIREDDARDDAQLTTWIKKAAALPGEKI